MVFVLTLVLFWLKARSRKAPLGEIFTIEEIFVPLASISLVLLLATLAFLAVFKVLIKDFFWIDIGRSPSLKFLIPVQTQYLYARDVPIDRVNA
jgi:hypothetical protein